MPTPEKRRMPAATAKNRSAHPAAARPAFSALRDLAPAALLMLAVLALWELAVRIMDVPVFVLPPPTSIASVLATR
ncbi:hypothetical protein FGX01_03275, partial [Xylella fastidiosa subsp. multiplex]|nr:hypothetical protein [Xylella fastidiosa subsp. multiplex]